MSSRSCGVRVGCLSGRRRGGSLARRRGPQRPGLEGGVGRQGDVEPRVVGLGAGTRLDVACGQSSPRRSRPLVRAASRIANRPVAVATSDPQFAQVQVLSGEVADAERHPAGFFERVADHRLNPDLVGRLRGRGRGGRFGDRRLNTLFDRHHRTRRTQPEEGNGKWRQRSPPTRRPYPGASSREPGTGRRAVRSRLAERLAYLIGASP